MNKLIGLIIILQFLIHPLSAQDSEKNMYLGVHGYLSAMPSLYWNKDTAMWQVLVHNRINIDLSAGDHFSASVQFRNQLIGGDFVHGAGYKDGIVKQNYYLPLTLQQTFGDYYLLSLSVDRAWVQYTYKNLEIKLGRQRINWGQTFVWNPNDIFNTYNFFDFDYPERPGADALRIQYYTSGTSSLDLAAKVDSSGDVSGAALYRFNHWNTDFQFLGGYFNQSNVLFVQYPVPGILQWKDHDLTAGFGFSGAIKNVSIRGEASYFYSLKDNSDSTNVFLCSIAADYSFSNEAMIMGEFLYNSNVLLPGGSNFLSLYSGNQNVKTLSFTKYNIFGQFTYPVLPIFNVGLSAMYFFDDNLTGAYAGPDLDLSVGDNSTLSSYFQIFAFRVQDPATGQKSWANGNFVFLRYKWNF